MLAVSSRQVYELAYVVGAIGALVVAFGAFSVVSSRSLHRSGELAHRREKLSYLIGALLIAVAFVLALVALRTRTPLVPNPTGSPSAAAIAR